MILLKRIQSFQMELGGKKSPQGHQEAQSSRTARGITASESLQTPTCSIGRHSKGKGDPPGAGQQVQDVASGYQALTGIRG